MQNNSIHNTEGRTDYTLGGIREKSCSRPVVASPIAKSALLIQLFNQVVTALQPLFLPQGSFPLVVQDWRVCSRVKEILGISQNTKSVWRDKPYLVRGMGAIKWIESFEKMIGEDFIDAQYIVGSSANYIVGQPVLRQALETFLSFLPDTPQKEVLRAKLIGAIAQKTFSFADVDLRIKVKDTVQLDLLKKQIDEMEGCRTELFNGKVLIVYVAEFEENALDVMFYTELDNESATNLDDIKINIKKSDFQKNIIAFESVNPWKWWFGQVLGILENNTSDAYRAFPRIEWEICKGKISVLHSESSIFPRWIEKINRKSLTETQHPLKTQFDKQKENHDRLVPLVDFLSRLRIQQLIRDNSPDSYQALREAANTDTDKPISSFIRMLFKVMKEKGSDIEGIHALLESLALLALYEAWQKPFEVKLVQHEGTWVLRVRFRGPFGKRDLLLRFNVKATLEKLDKIKNEQLKKMRVIVHSLFFDGGLSERKVDSHYHKMLEDKTLFPIPLLAENIQYIKRKLFAESVRSNSKVVSLNDSSLGAAEISWNEDVDNLLELGNIIFDHYNHDLNLRYELCWKVVKKCIENRGYVQASKLVQRLRKTEEDPEEGYAVLFAQLLQKNCDSYLLYQACSPFAAKIDEGKWLDFSLSKTKIPDLFKLMNEIDVSAELFLEMVRLLRVAKPTVEENTLCKLIGYERRKASAWIVKHDRVSFSSKNYTKLVSEIIVEFSKSFDPCWIRDYIFSGRFESTREDAVTLCKYLLSKPLTAQHKTRILQALEVNDSSLWQMVANEYISEGEWPETLKKEGNIDFESLLLWHQIIDRANDRQFVEENIKKIKPPPKGVRDVIRGLALVRILKNWDKKPVDPQILKLIYRTKDFSWENVTQGAVKGEDILRALNNVSRPLYSVLFKAIKPKEEFYSRMWLKMVEQDFPGDDTEKLLVEMRKPEMTECLQINQKVTLPLFKRLAKDPEGVCFVLETLSEADQDIFYSMIETCSRLNDGGNAGAGVFMKFYDAKTHKKKTDFPGHLAAIAKSILKNPKGDVEAAVKIWKIVKDLANPETLPCTDNLLGIIRNEGADWVIQMLNKASTKELESVPAQIYRRLIGSIRDLKQKCLVLDSCCIFAKSIQKHWEILAQNDGLDPAMALNLLNSAEKLQGSDSKVQRCALLALTNASETKIVIQDRVLKYLLKMISRLDLENGCKLWESLQKSNRLQVIDLWSPAINILSRNPINPHPILLEWVTLNSSEQTNEQLLDLLLKTTQYPLEKRLQKSILRFIKKPAVANDDKARSIYWNLDCDDNITDKDLKIFCPTQKQCLKALNRLIEKSKVKITPTLCASIQTLWIEFGRMVKNRAEVDRETIDIMYRLMLSVRHVYEYEANYGYTDNICALISDDLDSCQESKALSDICKYLVDNHTITSPLTLYKIANATLKNKNFTVPDLYKILPVLAMSYNEKYLQVALMLYGEGQNFEKLSAKIVFLAHHFPQHIEAFQALVDKITDIHKFKYLNGILLSAKFIQNPTKGLALEYIDHLDFIWRSLSKLDWQDEAEDWEYIAFHSPPSVDMHTESGAFVPNPIFNHFFLFAYHNFIETQESIYFDPEVLQNILVMLSHCGNNLSFVQISFLRMLIRSLRKNFDEYAAHNIINFIFNTVPLYRNGISLNRNGSRVSLNEKDAEFLCGLLTNVASLIIEHWPNLVKWSGQCYSRILYFNNNYCQNFHKTIEKNFVAYLALKGDINGLFETPIEQHAKAIANTIQFLCSTTHFENHVKSLQLLIIYTPDILVFFPEFLKAANNAYVKATLNRMSDIEVKNYIPQFFMHLSDTELQAECYDMTEMKLQEYAAKLKESPITLQKIRQLQLELIYTNIVTILEAKPFLLTNIIDFLCTNTFLHTSNNYMENPGYIEPLLRFIKNQCHKSDQLALDKLTVLIYTHIQFTGQFLEDEYTKSYYEKLLECDHDIPTLMWLKPIRTLTVSMQEISMSYHWCRLITEAIQRSDLISVECFPWIREVKHEFILCLFLSTQIPVCGSLTINLIDTFGKLMNIIGIIGKTFPDEANKMLQELINDLRNALNDKQEWFIALIVEKISENMKLELVPSLPHLEQFHQKFNPLSKRRSCIDAYFSLIQNGCYNDVGIVVKAIENSAELCNRVRIKTEDLSRNFGNEGLYLEKSVLFSIKLDFIYLTGFNRLIDNFKVNKKREQLGEIPKGSTTKDFLDQIRHLRMHTDNSITTKRGNTKLLFLPSVLINKIHKNLKLFDNVILKEIMDMLMLLHEKMLLKEQNGDAAFPENQNKILLFTLFYQPDMRIENVYFKKMSEIYLNEVAQVDVTLWENTLFVKQAIKWIIMDDPKNTSNFGLTIRKKALTERWFKQLLFTALKEVRDELEHYKTIRTEPCFSDWYDFWIDRIQIFCDSIVETQLRNNNAFTKINK